MRDWQKSVGKPRNLVEGRHRTASSTLLAVIEFAFFAAFFALALFSRVALSSGSNSLLEPSPHQSSLLECEMGYPNTPFQEVKLHKHKDVPSLLRKVGNQQGKILASDAPSWLNKFDTWCACKNARGLPAVSNILGRSVLMGLQFSRYLQEETPTTLLMRWPPSERF